MESTFVGENVFQYNSGGVGYLAIGDTYQCYRIDYIREKKWFSKIDSVYIRSLTAYKDTIYY